MWIIPAGSIPADNIENVDRNVVGRALFFFFLVKASIILKLKNKILYKIV